MRSSTWRRWSNWCHLNDVAGDDESSVGCGLRRAGRMHVPIGGPLSLDAPEANGTFGGKRAARSRGTLRRNGASGRIAGDGEHYRPIIGFAVAITSLGRNREGAVERDLSNVRYPAPTGRSPTQVRRQDPTPMRRSQLCAGRRARAARAQAWRGMWRGGSA